MERVGGGGGLPTPTSTGRAAGQSGKGKQEQHAAQCVQTVGGGGGGRQIVGKGGEESCSVATQLYPSISQLEKIKDQSCKVFEGLGGKH